MLSDGDVFAISWVMGSGNNQMAWMSKGDLHQRIMIALQLVALDGHTAL